MKPSLAPGVRRTERIAVDESNTIAFLGDDLRVYSTPPMVHAVEYACYRLAGEHLDEGETSLGVHVAVDHLGATPAGHGVDVEVTVRSVEGRRVTFDAQVRDAVEVVGRGVHVRVVTEVDRFLPKVEAKRSRLAGASCGAAAAGPSAKRAPGSVEPEPP